MKNFRISFFLTLFILCFSFQSAHAQFSGWGLKDILKNSKEIKLKSLKRKKDVIIAMIDSGLKFNHPFIPKEQIYMPASHPMLPRAHWNKKVSSSFYGIDFSSKKMGFKPIDMVGHGTHVTGIVKQVFKEAKFLILKYYDPNGDNTDSSIQALEFAVKSPEVDIINYSGGGPGASLKEKNLIELAKRNGKILVAAAGNERSNIDYLAYHYYPASYGLENIISVAAHNEKGEIASASNWGKTVHLSAPGKLITSAFKDGKSHKMTGTSQATAFVSGAIGYIKSRFPSLSMIQIKRILIKSVAHNKKLKGKSLTQGMLRLKNAIKLAKKLALPKIKFKKLARKVFQKDKNIKRSVAKDI